MILWRIYYSDGSTFDNTQGGPSEAPRRGVQIILIKHGRKGVRKLRLADYYLWSPTMTRWLEAQDSAAVIVRALMEPHIILLAGEYISEEDHGRILIEADNDPDFPYLSAPPAHKAWQHGI